MAKKVRKELSFDLFNELQELDMDIFHEQLGWEFPSYISDNLKYKPRPYQSEAIRYFHYTQTSETFKYRKLNQLLFHMATGSGKTDLMAALILYLYKEKGYQNFLFTVNTNGVLNKTITNLTDPQSDKYLFQSNLVIEGQRITIVNVKDKFPTTPDKHTIYIKFVSIQTLTNDLYTQGENVMALKAYRKIKVAVLADEAHHYSASTKRKTKAEQEKASWEKSLLDILKQHKDNLLLEFTATLDFDDETIYEKYRNKISYRYTLDTYITDKYSKNVRRIQTGQSNEENMLSTVLLSEYRRRYAQEELDITIKPVILFKSHKIDVSYEANRLFNEMIENLTETSLKAFLETQKNHSAEEHAHTLQLAYQYYLDLDNLSTVVRDIKRHFAPTRILNANDTDRGTKGLLEAGQYQALNSLEQPNNLYRVVFAVAKLTEGWDVLNLYDIVRISSLGKQADKDKRDAKSTNSEAQLIGRGARYYPFKCKGEVSYTRRFDESNETASLLLETLHYHTLNEPQYIKNLMASLDSMNIVTGTDSKNPLIAIKLKPSFKKTDIYQKGRLFYNETTEVLDSDYTNLNAYGIALSRLATIPYYKSTQELDYQVNETLNTKITALQGIDRRYFTKAISRSSFYKFNNLKHYLPNLKSMADFYGSDWLDLNNLTLSVETEESTVVESLTPLEKLNIVDRFLEKLATNIKAGYRKKRGTNRFIGYPIKDYIEDYRKRVPNYDTANHSSQTIEQNVINHTFNQYDFFAYQSAIINQNEKNLVDAIANHVEELKETYGDVFLIRMDENMLRGTEKAEQLKLHQFETNPREINFSGFQPDFILLLKNQDFYIQLFIEPKGEHLLERDKWKEEILTYITDHQEDLVFEKEYSDVIVKGLRFYTTEDKNNTINQIANTTLDRPQFRGNIKPNIF